MSKSHAGTSLEIFLAVFRTTQKVKLIIKTDGVSMVASKWQNGCQLGKNFLLLIASSYGIFLLKFLVDRQS